MHTRHIAFVMCVVHLNSNDILAVFCDLVLYVEFKRQASVAILT